MLFSFSFKMQMNLKIDFYRSLNLTNFAANLYVLPFQTDKSIIVILFRRLLKIRIIELINEISY